MQLFVLYINLEHWIWSTAGENYYKVKQKNKLDKLCWHEINDNTTFHQDNLQ